MSRRPAIDDEGRGSKPARQRLSARRQAFWDISGFLRKEALAYQNWRLCSLRLMSHQTACNGCRPVTFAFGDEYPGTAGADVCVRRIGAARVPMDIVIVREVLHNPSSKVAGSG